jgi:hypothetical protein
VVLGHLHRRDVGVANPPTCLWLAVAGGLLTVVSPFLLAQMLWLIFLLGSSLLSSHPSLILSCCLLLLSKSLSVCMIKVAFLFGW